MKNNGTVSVPARGLPATWLAVAAAVLVAVACFNFERVERIAADGIATVQARRDARPGTTPPPPASTPVVPVPQPPAPPAPPQDTAALPQPLPLLRPIETVPVPVAATAPAAPAPPAGQAGLVALLRSGVLKPASGRELAQWKARHAANNPGGPGRRFEEWLRTTPTYVVVGDMQIPEGLTGAHAVVFVLDANAPFPTGHPGHSVILEPVSGSCIGTICGFLMRE